MVYHRNIHHSCWLLYVLLAYFICLKIRFLSGQGFNLSLHFINDKRYVLYSSMFIRIRAPRIMDSRAIRQTRTWTAAHRRRT